MSISHSSSQLVALCGEKGRWRANYRDLEPEDETVTDARLIDLKEGTSRTIRLDGKVVKRGFCHKIVGGLAER